MSDVRSKAIEHGMNVYGRMLDLDDAHIEDAVRTGMGAAVASVEAEVERLRKALEQCCNTADAHVYRIASAALKPEGAEKR